MDYDLRAQRARSTPDAEGVERPDATTELWFQAVAEGFHDARMRGQGLRLATEVAIADQSTLRGVYLVDPPRTTLDPNSPVATMVSFDKTLNTGAGRLVGLHMITDVTVRPSHRRRGLLRRMMTTDLTAAKESGIALAALTVTEGSIYGRFGFGPATWVRHISLDTSRRFGLREEASGRVEMIDPHSSADLFARVFDRFHARTRGSVARPSWYREVVNGLHDPETNEADQKLRAAVHHSQDGEVDGYVSYRVERDPASGHRELHLRDLVTTSSEAYLGLWQFLASVDLVEKVVFRRSAMEDPLEFALADPRLYSVTKLEDQIWLRVLDVPAALQAREWYHDGSVVLEVLDDLGLAGGRYQVSVSEGRASVVETTAEAEVTLDVTTLGSLYLGGVTVHTLRRSARFEGSEQAVDRFARLMELPTRPYCITGF